MRNNIFSSSFILLSVFIASGILYSCNDRLPERWAAPIIPSEGMVLKTFRVEISPMTKTIMNNDGEIKWLAGDQVSVFDDKKGVIGNPVYVSNSTITAEVEASASHYYSLSPYSNAVVYDALSKEIKTVLPLSQYPAPGNMDKEANLLFAVSKSGDDKMVYSNMCAIVRFSIADEDIAALKFEGLNGEKLAGGVTIKKEKEIYRNNRNEKLKELKENIYHIYDWCLKVRQNIINLNFSNSLDTPGTRLCLKNFL